MAARGFANRLLGLFLVAIFVVAVINAFQVVGAATYDLRVVAGIRVGNGPEGIAYDSNKGEIFVANYESNTVSVISDNTNTVIANVTVGTSPAGVAYNSGKGEVWVTNNGEGTVSVISDSTNTVVANVTVENNPIGIAYDSEKREMFVTNNGDGTVSVISDSSNSVITTLTLSPWAYQPWGVAYNPRKDEVYVSDSAIGGVIAISDQSNTIVANVTPGTIQSNGLSYSKPLGIAYDNAKDEIFVAMNQAKKVFVISDASNKPSPSPTVPEFNSAFLVLVTAIITITYSAWFIVIKRQRKEV